LIFEAEKFFQIAQGADVGLGAREKGLDPHVHHEPALDLLHDPSPHRPLAAVGLVKLVPGPALARLVLGEAEHAVFLVPTFHHDLDGLSHLDPGLAVGTAEFVQGHIALGLAPDIH
jgi:hypothetical protein